MEDIEHYGIPVYNFPFDVEEDDEDTIQDNSELRVRTLEISDDDPAYKGVQALLPFAIVGSEEEIEINGELVRARRYPWGIVEIDNPKHSDFLRLRSALLNTHLTDLKEITHGARHRETAQVDLNGLPADFLYENYRTEKLSRSVNNDNNYTQDSSILPEDLATQSVRLKEEQVRPLTWLATTKASTNCHAQLKKEEDKVSGAHYS
jgi:cell division control protein 11